MSTTTELFSASNQPHHEQPGASGVSSIRGDAIELEERRLGTPPYNELNLQVRTPAAGEEEITGFDFTNIATVEDIPPDGGYGWVVTLCVFLTNANTWGVNASWGVFLNHFLTDDSYPGASKFLYALIGGLSISQSLFVAPLVVASHGRFGPRITMLFGAVMLFASHFAAGSSTEIWQLIITQGLMFGWGMGFLYITATEVLPHWFSRHRSLAVGFATSGSGLGGLAYSLLTGILVQSSGVMWTYRILSFCALGMNLLSIGLIRQRPVSEHAKKVKSKAFNPRHFFRVEILLVVLWGFVTELGFITLLYSLPTYATSIGLDAFQGSVVQALLYLGLAVGRPIMGYYSDRVGRINIALFGTAICTVFVFSLWLPAHSYGVLLAFAILAGTVCGTFWSAISPVLAEVVGLVELGGVFGSICFALVLPTTFAEAIAIQIVDGHPGGAAGGEEGSAGHEAQGLGQFVSGQVFVGCMFLIGALSLVALRSWKIADKENKEEMEALREREGRSRTGWASGGSGLGTPSGVQTPVEGVATPSAGVGGSTGQDGEVQRTAGFMEDERGSRGWNLTRQSGRSGFWLTPRRAFRLERV